MRRRFAGSDSARKIAKTENGENALLSMCDDLLSHIISYLSFRDISRLIRTCKDLHKSRTIFQRLAHFVVNNKTFVEWSCQQTRLQSLALYGVENIQHLYSSLPHYTYIGDGCELGKSSMYNGLSIGSSSLREYKTRVLFIERARVSIDFRDFPNLEELYVYSDAQLNAGFDLTTLHLCKHLRKIVILVEKASVTVPREVFSLPNLELFAVRGQTTGRFTVASQKMHTFIFNKAPQNVSSTCLYFIGPTTTHLYHMQFQYHHRAPRGLLCMN